MIVSEKFGERLSISDAPITDIELHILYIDKGSIKTKEYE